MSLIAPAFSVNTKMLRELHPNLTPDQIWKVLELTLQTEAFQSMLLDTFDLLANREPTPTPAPPTTPNHENNIRLAVILHQIRNLQHAAIAQCNHTLFPDALWKSFIAQAKPDQPPHYSSAQK